VINSIFWVLGLSLKVKGRKTNISHTLMNIIIQQTLRSVPDKSTTCALKSSNNIWNLSRLFHSKSRWDVSGSHWILLQRVLVLYTCTVCAMHSNELANKCIRIHTKHTGSWLVGQAKINTKSCENKESEPD